MKKAMVFTVLAGALVFAAAGSAITNGVPDGNAHPEVGALLAQQAFSDGTWEECTGTLIAPRIFLTAEHCDEGVSRVAVTARTSRPRSISRSRCSSCRTCCVCCLPRNPSKACSRSAVRPAN